MLKDAIAVWKALEGQVRKTVKDMNGKSLQCERYDVTTAPNAATGKIGVSQPFGNEIFVPYSAACAGASVGDSVMVFWWKSLSNAKAWYMGDAIGEGGGGSAEKYEVGDIYITTSATSPAARFGGTWERIQNRFLLAAGSSYAAGATGGEAAHTLTEAEIATHNHSVAQQYLHRLDSTNNDYVNYNNEGSYGGFAVAATSTNKGTTRLGIPAHNTNSAGGGQAHNNMPPYLAVYMWKRIA